MEVTHALVGDLTGQPDALLRPDPAPRLPALGDALVNERPLAGEGLLGAWRARLLPYPRPRPPG